MTNASDFYEIDFLDVESSKSGDAIALRYRINGTTQIHVVDGGFQETGERLAEHIRQYYGQPTTINRVVATHPDGDHAGGLRAILEKFQVGELWMFRPWLYSDALLSHFPRFQSSDSLTTRLKEIYPNIAALEEIALRRGIPMLEPSQGSRIGAFTVLSPTYEHYFRCLLNSEKTPETLSETRQKLAALLAKAVAKVVTFVKSAWGAESFSPDETSSENEMSVVQYAFLCEKKILLTADAGRVALAAAADYAIAQGLALPGIDRFQVPHHGSRRNVSAEVLDQWLGPRLRIRPANGAETFTAIISSAKKDEDHPRKAVVRAMIHRGAKVLTTEGASLRVHQNAPARNWGPAKPCEYPEEQES